ncbi:MAG: dipeptidase [Candidatus Dormibacteraeota bacterium]|nr:dipeptidase [Candidatus Dormibacteraeota bacterium]
MTATDLDAYCAAGQDRFTGELVEFLRIPSISADPAHGADVRRSAEHVLAGALEAGFTRAEIIETAGNPSVYAERMVDPSLPTALIYGHHDVQPVDPLDEWHTAPFEPAIRGGDLFARGAADDKGQVWMHLKAVEALVRARGELPLNLKLIVEGEEESGSIYFEDLVAEHLDRLRADVLVVSDTAMVGRDRPSLTTGLRGLAALEVTVSGPGADLHSGRFGGAVANPIAALAEILAGLHDPVTNRVTVPHFYDDVRELTDQERTSFAAIPLGDGEFLAMAEGAPAAVGEAGFSTLERLGARPTLEFNGIWGGYAGPGSKTIIPATAAAKITCRLVAEQDPGRIAREVARAVTDAAPPGVSVEVDTSAGGRPVVTPVDHPAVQAMARAVTRVFGTAPLFLREGGSIPPVEIFSRRLGMPAVLAGFGLPDDRIHAPNEKFSLDMYARGIRTLAHAWTEIALALARPRSTV